MTEEILALESVAQPRVGELVTPQDRLMMRLQPEKFVGPEQVTVVIPTLNEKEGIGKVIDDLKRAGFENILVVDGYSEDDTLKITKSRGVEWV